MPKVLALALVLILAALPLAATEAGAEAVQLLQNPGFEEGLEPWIGDHAQPELVESTQPGHAPHVHDGGYAVSLAGSAPYDHRLFQQLKAVEPGQDYELSVWVWLDDPNVSRFGLYANWYDASSGLGTDSLLLTARESTYRFFSTTVHSPPRATRVDVGVTVSVNAGSQFHLYLDDFSFEGPPPSPQPSPTGAPVATPSPTPAVPPPRTPTPRPTSTPAPQPTPPPVTAPGATAGQEPLSFPSLTNGGFEELRADGSPYGWRKIGGEIRATGAPRAEGAYSLAITSRTSSTKWAYQVVRVQPGGYYQAEALARPPDGGEVFLRVSWYASQDGAGVSLDSGDSTRVIADASGFGALTTGTLAAPADANSAGVRLMMRPGASAETTAYFDAVRFVPVEGDDYANPVSRGSVSSSSGGRHAYKEDYDSPRALGASSSDANPPPKLANVKPAAQSAPPTLRTRNRASNWAIPLAVTAPVVAVVAGAGIEFARRRRRGPAEEQA